MSQGRRNQCHERVIGLGRQIMPAAECEDCGIAMIEERVVVLTMDEKVGFCKALSWSSSLDERRLTLPNSAMVTWEVVLSPKQLL